jgi:hypothetical protein
MALDDLPKPTDQMLPCLLCAWSAVMLDDMDQ